MLLACANPFSQGATTMALGDTDPVKKAEIDNLMAHLQEELEKGGLFRSPEQKPTLMRNIGNFFPCRHDAARCAHHARHLRLLDGRKGKK